MLFFVSLIPATFAAVVGYFVLFSSAKAQGGVRTFGQILSTWIFIFAELLPIAGGYATYAGFSPETMRSMHSGEKR